MTRDIPFKIKLIGFLHVLFGILLLINGIYFLILVSTMDGRSFSEAELFKIKNVTISLYVTLAIVSLLFIIIGWRLWRAKRWTRWFTVLLPITYFVVDLLLLHPDGISFTGITIIIVYSMIPSYLFFNDNARKCFQKCLSKKEFFDF